MMIMMNIMMTVMKHAVILTNSIMYSLSLRLLCPLGVSTSFRKRKRGTVCVDFLSPLYAHYRHNQVPKQNHFPLNVEVEWGTSGGI